MDECRKQFEELMRQPPYEMDLARHSDAGSWPGNYRSYPVQLAWCAWEDLWNRRAMLEAAQQPPAIDRDAVIALLSDDALATSFQTLGQYRAHLIGVLKSKE